MVSRSDNPDSEEAEDLAPVADDSSDDEEHFDPVAPSSRQHELDVLVGQEVPVTANRVTTTWKVIAQTADSTIEERSSTHFAGFSGGLRAGLPTFSSGKIDYLALWLLLYPGDMDEDIKRLNQAGRDRGDKTWKDITAQEWVKFWGLIIAAT
eukprot:scaffold108899_cov15-Prasinocladus_malaysianus.AAC.2